METNTHFFGKIQIKFKLMGTKIQINSDFFFFFENTDSLHQKTVKIGPNLG